MGEIIKTPEIQPEVEVKENQEPINYLSKLSEEAGTTPGKLHEFFTTKTEEIAEPEALDLKAKLGKSTIEEIRYTQRLLKEPVENEGNDKKRANLKEETAKRIKAYANKSSDNWYVLDYSTVGGREHEMGIGLGDILLDTDIKQLLVEKNGETILATRGVIENGEHAGRVGFKDTYGDYVATYDGDKFRILSDTEMSTAEYLKTLEEETLARNKHKGMYEAETEALAEAEPEAVSPLDTYVASTGKFPPKVPTTPSTEIVTKTRESKMTASVVSAATRETRKKPTNIEEVPETRPNMLKVFDYVAKVVDLPPELLIGTAQNESRFRYTVGDRGKSIGVLQLRPNELKRAKKTPLYKQVVGQFYKYPENVSLGASALVDILTAAIMLKKAANNFKFDIHYDTNLAMDKPDKYGFTRTEWLRISYKLPAYANSYAKAMKGVPGHPTSKAVRGIAGHRFKKTKKGPVDRFARFFNNTKRARTMLEKWRTSRGQAQSAPGSAPDSPLRFTLGENDLIYSLGAKSEKANRSRAKMVASLANTYYEDAKLGFSGGHTREGLISEAEEQRDQIQEYGISNKIGLVDQKATNTYENMSALVDYVQSLPENERPKRILIVSSKARHCKRAIVTLKKILKKRGIDALNVEISYYASNNQNIDKNVGRV